MWRTGTSVGRTVYIQRGDGPSQGDHLIGLMDTPALAALIVAAVNAYVANHDDVGTWPDADPDMQAHGAC